MEENEDLGIFKDVDFDKLPRLKHNMSDRGIGKLDPVEQHELEYCNCMSGRIDSEALRKYCDDNNV